MEDLISLDPSVVLQRHTLEDSDDDDGGDAECGFVAEPATATIPRSLVIFAFGTTASIFTKSYISLEESSPTYKIQSDCVTVFKNKSFPVSSKEKISVSEVYDLKSKNGTNSLCVHKSELKSINCREWCSLVCYVLKTEQILLPLGF